MLKKQVVILHDYGAKDHYTALYALKDECDIENFEFTIFPTLIRGLLKFDFRMLMRALNNLSWIVLCLIFPSRNAGKNIILGMAPFDWRIIYIKRLLKYSNVILHTSWTSWNDDFHPRKNKFFNEYFKRIWKKFIICDVRHIAAVTDVVRHEIIKFTSNFSVESKIKCVYHSIHDITNFTPKLECKDSISILFVGNIIEQKGIYKIIDLCALNPEIKFTFVGRGPLLNELKNSNLPNISCLGYIQNKLDLYKVYSEHDIYLLPSVRKGKWEELFGIALVEAMYHRCIPVTTDHSGPSEILKDSFLYENVFCEDKFVNETNLFIDKIKDDCELLNEYKNEAHKLATKFTSKNLSKIWGSMLV